MLEGYHFQRRQSLVMIHRHYRIEVATIRVIEQGVRAHGSNHIQPCACTLCRERPDEERNVKVLGIGRRNGTIYVLLPEGYECPASEVERAPLSS